MKEKSRAFTAAIANRETVMEGADMRAVVLTLDQGQNIPWHYHSTITDAFVCLKGPMVVETREPEQRFDLTAGQMCAVPAQRPHTVHGKDGGPCRFANLQGVGHYDFKPLPKE